MPTVNVNVPDRIYDLLAARAKDEGTSIQSMLMRNVGLQAAGDSLFEYLISWCQDQPHGQVFTLRDAPNFAKYPKADRLSAGRRFSQAVQDKELPVTRSPKLPNNHCQYIRL